MLKTQIKNKSIPVLVKIPKEILQQLQVNADLYAEGNLSEWLRYSGLNHVPNKEDLVQLKKSAKKLKKK